MQRSVAQSEILGKRLEYLWAKVRIGHLALRMNSVDEARAIFADTLEEFQNIYPLGVTFSIEGMAGLFVAVGDLKNAARMIGWAERVAERYQRPSPAARAEGCRSGHRSLYFLDG